MNISEEENLPWVAEGFFVPSDTQRRERTEDEKNI